MNKTAIKNFAVWARQKLISDITYKAGMLGITENGIGEKLPQSTADLHFFDIGTKNYSEVSGVEIRQREALIKAIREREHSFKSFQEAFYNTVEEVAYTWFNRLIAIRFMEVNDYLPSGVRVLSSENKAKNEPDFVTSPFDTDLEFSACEQDRVFQLKDENKLDELFRMLFIKQCNKLNGILPELFEKTDDYTELLLTISFTDKDGVVYRLVHDISEDDFNVEKEGQVEIIGWMYQYYNSELKDDTFAKLKKKIKIEKDRIPAATQLFTPDWIVRYMVENSLGRMWLEGHPSETLKLGWKYYLDEAEQEEEVKQQLETIRKEYAGLKPEEIHLIDPCMGSGHILVYAFDVFMQIYENCGYTQREAAKSILSNNIYGLDIDKRAYQLSYFALMMKARQYNRRILNEGIKPNVFYIRDNSALSSHTIDYIAKDNEKIKAGLKSIADDLNNATEYGSLVSVAPVDFCVIYNRLEEMKNGEIDLFSMSIPEQVTPIIRQAEVLSQKYDVVVTNPPYMGAGNMGSILLKYVKSNYPNSKSDLSTAFMEKTLFLCNHSGYMAMINIPVWMFLSSYERLRELLIRNNTFISMVHPGRGIFGSDFGTTAFIIGKKHIDEYIGHYRRLFKKQGEVESIEEREHHFFEGRGCFYAKQSNFFKIPGSPVAYWVGEAMLRVFEGIKVADVAETCTGLTTGDNGKFLRLWFEVSYKNIKFNANNTIEANNSEAKWFPYHKGGEFRRWYGNNNYIINWEHDGQTLRAFSGSTIRNTPFYFRKGITWSLITSSIISFRYRPIGFIFGDAGPAVFPKSIDFNVLFGLLNTKITQAASAIINPTINSSSGVVASFPAIVDVNEIAEIDSNVDECVTISKADWDSFETSWDFKKHPMI